MAFFFFFSNHHEVKQDRLCFLKCRAADFKAFIQRGQNFVSAVCVRARVCVCVGGGWWVVGGVWGGGGGGTWTRGLLLPVGSRRLLPLLLVLSVETSVSAAAFHAQTPTRTQLAGPGSPKSSEGGDGERNRKHRSASLTGAVSDLLAVTRPSVTHFLSLLLFRDASVQISLSLPTPPLLLSFAAHMV